MIRRISALVLAIVLLGSVQACTMPDAIFADDNFGDEETHHHSSASEVYDFELSLDNQTYVLPANYGAFSARGWKFAEAAESVDDADKNPDNANKADNTATDKEEVKIYNKDSELEAGEYSEYVPLVNKDHVIGAKFFNPGKKTKNITECKVAGIVIDSEYGDVPLFGIVNNSITVGSKYDAVINKCGIPSYVVNVLASTGEQISINDVKFIDTDEEPVTTLYYKLTDHSFISFELGTYNDEDNSVVSITVENDYEAEKPYDYTKEKKYVPDNVQLYKGPNLLGKQFSDFAFKFEGKLYTLPLPVRTLMDDGWEFVRGYGERIPMGSTVDGLVMRKGNLAINLMVHNYDTKYSHTAINCYAVNIQACLTGPNASILLSKGVTLGSTEKELISAFGKDYAKTHPLEDEEGNYLPASSDEYTFADMPGCSIIKTVEDDYTVYSYIMPDDVPTIELPVSITDIGDPGSALLGDVRKHIDVYVDNATHLIYKFYLQNCPEYVVDEAKIIEEQLEAQRKKEKEEWEKAQKEKEEAEG